MVVVERDPDHVRDLRQVAEVVGGEAHGRCRGLPSPGGVCHRCMRLVGARAGLLVHLRAGVPQHDLVRNVPRYRAVIGPDFDAVCRSGA